MATIFCIANQKGGVGKTTTTVNLAAGLARLDQKVLLVDLDPQGNATMGSGIQKSELETSVYQVLLGLDNIESACMRSSTGNYDLLPSNRDLAGAEVEMVDIDRREIRLKKRWMPFLTDTTSHRLSSGLVPPDPECVLFGKWCHHPDAMRILCSRRFVRSGQHDQAGSCQYEP
mgnify:CR=1 FL=1